MYVPMCFTKKTNLYLAAFFREQHLAFREGWMLIKDCERYEKLGYSKEIRDKLRRFIDSYEKPPNEDLLFSKAFPMYTSTACIYRIKMEIC